MIISPQTAQSAGYITNITNPDKQVGSDGIDLTIKSISRLADSAKPISLSESKQRTQYLNHIQLTPIAASDGPTAPEVYHLNPGVYDLTFNEGCQLPLNVAATLHLRSSLSRNGCVGVSGLYDSGFTTSYAGMTLHVNYPITIECGMRVAQIVLWESTSAKLYNGTYNNQTGSSWQETARANIEAARVEVTNPTPRYGGGTP